VLNNFVLLFTAVFVYNILTLYFYKIFCFLVLLDFVLRKNNSWIFFLKKRFLQINKKEKKKVWITFTRNSRFPFYSVSSSGDLSARQYTNQWSENYWWLSEYICNMADWKTKKNNTFIKFYTLVLSTTSKANSTKWLSSS
jgi:hypothetical protein